MKDTIIRFRSFLLRHVKNPKLRTLIWGLISYEMISYVLFGVGTVIIDYSVFFAVTALGMHSLISNVISTLCAIIFAYVTNKLWVFKSKTNGTWEVLQEFFRFANVRFATLFMSEFMLLLSHIFHGNDYVVKLIAMILTVILNYIFSKLFIFNKKRKELKNGNQKQT